LLWRVWVFFEQEPERRGHLLVVILLTEDQGFLLQRRLALFSLFGMLADELVEIYKAPPVWPLAQFATPRWNSAVAQICGWGTVNDTRCKSSRPARNPRLDLAEASLGGTSALSLERRGLKRREHR
jgi:hypothetical protein